MTPTYIDNLCRLGLAEVPPFFEYTTPGIYDPLEKHPEVESVKKAIELNEKVRAVVQRKGLLVTELGKQFCKICVISHEQKGLPKRTDT